MKKQLSKSKKLAFSTVLLAFIILVPVLLYLTTILWRTAKLRHSENRWSDNVFQADSRYGYSPIPNKKVFHTLETGERVPVVFDENGFRKADDHKSANQTQGETRKKILFLGCSFTHGYGVPAEKTFPALVGPKLDMEALNAAVPGWGLAQMQLKAEELIPKIRPDITIVQYSKWLAQRSQELYAPFNFGRTPTPYYYLEENIVKISPPAFRTTVYELPLLEARDMSFFQFLEDISLKMLPHDDFHTSKTRLKIILGLIPPPCKSRNAINKHAYAETQKICEQHNSKIFVLRLYGSPKDIEEKFEIATCPIVDTFNTLSKLIPEKNEKAWKQAYCFTDPQSGKVIDSHPNAKAHEIIAEEIVKVLNAELSK